MNHNKVIKQETNSDELAVINRVSNSVQKCSLYTAQTQHHNHVMSSDLQILWDLW
jgi:hypothetical protein